MNYCWECGEALVETKSGPKSFSAETGRPRFRYQRRCPNKRWWNRHTDARLIAFTDAQADDASDWDWHAGWD